MLLERAVGLQRVVACSHRRLFFQPLQVGIELAQDVFHAGQVFTRVVQTVGGFAATLLVFGNPGSFFQKQPQLFGFGLDDAADSALANDGVSARPQAGAQKHVLHVTATHRLVVDVVAGGAITREHALDGDFNKLSPLSPGAVIGVVEHQLDAGAACGLAGGGAVENHVLHRLATQFRGLGFAQHPAYRIHDVGFAAAVGSDHTYQLAWQQKIGRFCERLEAR